MIKFSEFLENIEEAVIKVKHHLSQAAKMKQNRLRKKASYKLRQKILARIRARKHCPEGQAVNHDGRGCHKVKHLVGLAKRY